VPLAPVQSGARLYENSALTHSVNDTVLALWAAKSENFSDCEIISASQLVEELYNGDIGDEMIGLWHLSKWK